MGNPICAFSIVRTKLAKQLCTFVDSMICKLSLAQYSGRNFVGSNYPIPRESVKDLLLVSRYQIRFQFPQLGVLLTFDLFVLSPKVTINLLASVSLLLSLFACLYDILFVLSFQGHPKISPINDLNHSSLAPNKIKSSPVEYLQPWGKSFIGITLPELTPLVLTGMKEGQ